MAETTKLSKSYTVAAYKCLIAELDTATPIGELKLKSKVADFITERFTERYITPINSSVTGHKHGFCTMAISCLMIEALESFWNGWEDTDRHGNEPGKSGTAFKQFFARSPAFSVFVGTRFYKHVRCGILHQAETTGGWTINRSGELFAKNDLSIDATKFHKAVEGALHDYAMVLQTEDFRTSERWKLFKKKMDYVCKNCQTIRP